MIFMLEILNFTTIYCTPRCAAIASYTELDTGSVIFREGDACNQVYILISGSVLIDGVDVVLEGTRYV